GPADPFAQSATGADRRAIGGSARRRRSAPRLQGELRRRPPAPRPATAERGDRYHRQRPVVPAQRLWRKIEVFHRSRLEALDHEVRLRRECEHALSALASGTIDHRAALGSVEEAKERTVLSGRERRSRRCPPPQRIASGRLDLQYLGARIGEKLGAVRT